MESEKFTFSNRDGITLAGRIEYVGDPKTWAVFAHCFTCSKDVAAASRISRALGRRGVGVLRFDFTGLGNSEGDFENTNFSSNVADLIDAAKALAQEKSAPRLLIGHSLGGAAVLVASTKLEHVDAVVTIGAPASPEHVRKLLKDEEKTIQEKGEGKVSLAGREFVIKKQFLDDISEHKMSELLKDFHSASLILHSPLDKVVGISNAEKIFSQIRGPKSFVSLNDMDHLLSKRGDSEYVAHVIAAWVGRYLRIGSEGMGQEEESSGPEKDGEGEVQVEEGGPPYVQNIRAAAHAWNADEPKELGGGNQGPTPYDLLLSALGTCTSMTIRMYANRHEMPLDHVRVTLTHERVHAKDCKDCESSEGKVAVIQREVFLKGDLSNKQREKLMEIANRCPVHQTLMKEIKIETKPG